MNVDGLKQLASCLEEDLLRLYGSPMLSGDDLQRALGYRSKDALRQAILRQTVPVKVFTIPNRRGRFALVKDIAHWLAEQRLERQYNKGETPID